MTVLYVPYSLDSERTWFAIMISRMRRHGSVLLNRSTQGRGFWLDRFCQVFLPVCHPLNGSAECGCGRAKCRAVEGSHQFSNQSIPSIGPAESDCGRARCQGMEKIEPILNVLTVRTKQVGKTVHLKASSISNPYMAPTRINQLQAQETSRTCNESEEEEEAARPVCPPPGPPRPCRAVLLETAGFVSSPA